MGTITETLDNLKPFSSTRPAIGVGEFARLGARDKVTGHPLLTGPAPLASGPEDVRDHVLTRALTRSTQSTRTDPEARRRARSLCFALPSIRVTPANLRHVAVTGHAHGKQAHIALGRQFSKDPTPIPNDWPVAARQADRASR